MNDTTLEPIDEPALQALKVRYIHRDDKSKRGDIPSNLQPVDTYSIKAGDVVFNKRASYAERNIASDQVELFYVFYPCKIVEDKKRLFVEYFTEIPTFPFGQAGLNFHPAGTMIPLSVFGQGSFFAART